MIPALALLLCCQLAGEIAVRLSGLPLPGPVLGLCLMLALLFWLGANGKGAEKPEAFRNIDAVTSVLLANLSLLFVPAGVGVIQRLDVLGRHWLALLLALTASSLLGLVAAAYVFRFVARRIEEKGRRP